MAWNNVSNNSQTTLWAAITDTTATTIQVVADNFLVAPFYLTLGDTPALGEIVLVTSKSGLTFTVLRAQDNTTAKTFPINSKVQLLINAALVNEIHSGINNSIMFPWNNSVLFDGITVGNFMISLTPVILGSVTLG